MTQDTGVQLALMLPSPKPDGVQLPLLATVALSDADWEQWRDNLDNEPTELEMEQLRDWDRLIRWRSE